MAEVHNGPASVPNSAAETGPSAAAAQPPLVALDPAGTPTPLSYNVPAPMAYSGRNFITIDLPPEAFSTPAVNPEEVLALVPSPSGEARDGAVAQASLPDRLHDVLSEGEGSAGEADGRPAGQPIVAMAPTAMTAELAGLTVGDARLLAERGQRPVL
jgi:hypothetical protein